MRDELNKDSLGGKFCNKKKDQGFTKSSDYDLYGFLFYFIVQVMKKLLIT